MSVLSSIIQLFSPHILDSILVLVCIFYALEGYALGFVAAFLDLLSFIISFLLGLRFYSLVGVLLVAKFNMPLGFANAASFFIVASTSELILGFLSRRLHKVIVESTGISETQEYTQINKILGILLGLLSAVILLIFLLTLIVTLPFSPTLKRVVSDSTLASAFIAQGQGLEKNLHGVFGGAIKDSLSFITVEPKSNESVNLHFKTTNVSVDTQAEDYMLTLVNKERASRGIVPLVMDDKLRLLARSHAKDMFARGYFSHFTPEGLDPFMRMQQANITYTTAGENLALAPNTDLAMQGLMNSPGHRANILSPNFGKIGIGVIDGGIYGEMFDQEFTD